MAEESTTATEDPTSTPQVPEGTDTPTDPASIDQAATEAESTPEQVAATSPDAAASAEGKETPPAQATATTTTEPAAPTEPDAIQPLIDKAFETIQHEIEVEMLGKFLRSHVKTFQEEWEGWSDNAKVAYVHMMASQLVQRKAAATRIKIYEEFKLPVPSAQTTLFESIKQSQVKPQKRYPVLLLPPNLRPTYSLKK